MTARIHWTSYVFAAITIGCISASKAQPWESVHVKTATVRAVQSEQHLPGSGLIVPANFSTFAKPEKGPRQGEPPLVVKIAMGMGGSIAEHRKLYGDYQNRGVQIELRGPCYSACTLVTAHVDMDHICVAPGAFLAFHAAWTTWDIRTAQRHQIATSLMYATYPDPIRAWIDRHGGPDKLPGPHDGYWTMYDRDLWEMGYPKCK